MSLKYLPPTDREKQRYVVFRLKTEDGSVIKLGDLVQKLWETSLEVLGQVGTSKVNPWIMKDLYDKEKRLAGIRTNKDSVEEVRMVLSMVDKIKDTKVCLSVETVSGSIKKVREVLY